MEIVNAFVRWFWEETPPVSRAYMIASSLVTLALQLELISPLQLYFNPKLIFSHHQVSLADQYSLNHRLIERKLNHIILCIDFDH